MRAVALVLVVVAVVAPAPAHAQGASDQAAAEALFKQARDLMAAGNYAAACPKLAESQRLDPGAGTLLNLATCYEKNGQIASAWVTYDEAATAAQRANELARARLARSRAHALEATLPTLAIVVPPAADVPDLKIARDGEAVGRAAWGTAIPVDPGTHAIEATAPGRTPWHGQAQVDGPGAKVSIRIAPLAPAAEPPPPAPEARPQERIETPSGASTGSTQRVIGIVVAGLGLAGVAVGTTFGLVARSKNDDSASHCDAGVCDAQGLTSLDDARTAATASTIAFAAGGAAVAGGLLLYLLAPHAPAATGVVVSPTAAGSLAGLTVGGGWR